MAPLKDSMRKNIVVINADESLKKAIGVMSSKKIGCVVSVDKKKPVGILTERDVVRTVSRGLDIAKTRVRDVMSRKIISIDSGKSVQEAVDILEKNHIKKLPIIESGKLIGIVTMTDLLKSLRKLESNESERLKKTVKDLHLTKIKLQSRIIELEEKIINGKS